MTTPDNEVGARLRLRDRREFSADADRAARDVRGIGDASDRADSSGRRMGSGMGVARAGVGGLMGVASAGALAIGVLGAAAGATALKFVGMATDAAETESAFNTVFAGMTEQVGGFVEQMNTDFGIPTAELQNAAKSFGVFGKAAGIPADALGEFATSLTQASLDLGSFYNADPAEVFQAMQSGLAGETEALRRFGIFMSDASLNAFALTQGINKTTQEMSEGEKVALRQQFILANLGDAQGDLARTSGGLANQMRGLRGRFTEAGTAIGTALLPYVNSLVVMINDRIAPAVTWLQAELPRAVNDVAVAVGDSWVMVANAYDRAVESWSGGGSFGDVAAQATGMQSLVDPVNRVADALGDVWVIIRDGIVPAFMTVQDALPGVAQPLNAVDSALDFMADNASTLHPLLVGLVAVWTTWRFAVLAHTAVMAISGALMAARVGITMLLTGATGLNAAAELTRNQALVASIALHLRMAGALAASLARTVASTAATAGMAVVMGVVRGATMAWTAAQWLLNVALSANPIGLIVAAIALLVAGLVIAWQRSETFRNIVMGAFNAVKGAAMSAFNWIRDNFANILTIITGPFGMAVRLVVGNMDAIKAAVRGAINFLIDKWNGLSFTLPGLDVPGLGRIGGITLNTPDIPRLHTGGTVTGGGAVNMRPGEEVIVLPPAASVVPLSDTVRTAAASVAGAAPGQPIVLQLVVDRRVLAEQVYDHAGDQLARR
jgi:hypothetical protein